MAEIDTLLMLGRRPRTQEDPFGFVKASPDGRGRLYDDLARQAHLAQGPDEVEYHPDALAESDEILVANLDGFDKHFQENAPWSLERAVALARSTSQTGWLTSSQIAEGRWTFYLVASNVDGSSVVLIRAQNASYGMDPKNKLVTIYKGNELKVVDEPLLGFDGRADAIVIDKRVYVNEPRKIERLFIDADAVKARAPQAVTQFRSTLGAKMSDATRDALVSACEGNSNVARRVERLIRDGNLAKVTAKSVRDSLVDASEVSGTFGKSGPLVADNERLAKLLIDLAADLYYTPRYANTPRRVAAYRNLK